MIRNACYNESAFFLAAMSTFESRESPMLNHRHIHPHIPTYMHAQAYTHSLLMQMHKQYTHSLLTQMHKHTHIIDRHKCTSIHTYTYQCRCITHIHQPIQMHKHKHTYTCSCMQTDAYTQIDTKCLDIHAQT